MQSAIGLRNLGRVFLVLALTIGLVSFLAPTKAEAAVNSAEKQMASLINLARAMKGKPALGLSGSLSDLARRHSARMMSRNTIFHNPALVRWVSDYRWRVLGENVGMGHSIYSLHKAFMKSPGHRANNLNGRYRKVGVGVTSKNGRIFITVIFMG